MMNKEITAPKFRIDERIEFTINDEKYFGRIKKTLPYKEFIFFGDTYYKYKVVRYIVGFKDVIVCEDDICNIANDGDFIRKLDEITSLSIGDVVEFYSSNVGGYAVGRITHKIDDEHYHCSGKNHRISSEGNPFTLGLTTVDYMNTAIVAETVHKDLIHRI